MKDRWGVIGCEQFKATITVTNLVTGFDGSTATVQFIASANPDTTDKLLIWPPPTFQTVESIKLGTNPFGGSIDLILNSLTKYQGWRIGPLTWKGHVHYAIPFKGFDDLLKQFEHRDAENKLLCWCDYSEGYPELETDDPNRAIGWLRSLTTSGRRSPR